jgi:riboflavin kinase/FMN adenylyltransferase
VATTYVARFDARLASLLPAISSATSSKAAAGAVGARRRGFSFRPRRRATRGAAPATRLSVEAMRTIAVDGERASSTAVRTALAAGDVRHAAALLGRNYAIAGRVAHGDNWDAISATRRRTCRCAARLH